MQVAMNLKALAGLPIEQRRSELFKAVAFALAIPHLALDAMGAKALGYAKGVQRIGVQSHAAETDIKAFESVLRQKYATPNQNPVLTDPARKVQAWSHENMPELDIGYTALYDLVDMRGTGQSQFEISTTSAGITWTQRQPGAATEIRRAVAEATLPVPFIEFSAGLGILDVWLQFNQFWNISEAVGEFMATEADARAALHYGLITALSSGINQAFATDDATTFNNAASTVLRNLRGAGMGVGSNAQFDILCAPEALGRVLRVLDAVRGSPLIAFGTQAQPIAFQVRNVISSTHVPSNTNGYYLIMPGRKLKRGLWLDTSIESKRDVAKSAEDWVGRAQYNAAIGQTNQIRRVLFS